ncbi:IS3 family transposase [Spiroplasma endosymbiont of Melieria omissa]|uniref:IS3 family transposase n=1 Tax=Spiroplasma endosymbiont of Melieria omissa TaxID=3139324 RepID=UPI003CCAC46E
MNRNFNNRLKNEVIVSDLTYLQVNGKWNYICLLIDLFNREIIGHSVGTRKDALLVHQAFMQSNRCLKDIQIFHSDCGNEFNNKIIDKLLLAFNITRSLSKKGCPYDNAVVAEATFKTFKTEFINDKNFRSLIQLKLELFDYINWYNNIRIHSTLNYLTPVNYQKQMSTKK